MLNFFVKLEPNDLVSLVNEAIAYANQNYGVSLHDVARQVIVYEESCISDDGVELKLIKGISPFGNYHYFGDFYMNDFVLLVESGKMIDCSSVLHQFMVKRFGNEYSSFLHDMGIEIPKDEER